MVGLDQETQPNFQKGAAPRPVSLLQVATSQAVLLFDLLHFHGERTALDLVLTRVLHNRNTVKLGLGLGSDLLHLRRSYPSMLCFQNVRLCFPGWVRWVQKCWNKDRKTREKLELFYYMNKMEGGRGRLA